MVTSELDMQQIEKLEMSKAELLVLLRDPDVRTVIENLITSSLTLSVRIRTDLVRELRALQVLLDHHDRLSPPLQD